MFKSRSTYFLVFSCIAIIIVLSSCSNTKNLQKNEYLLHSQHIKGAKKIPSTALEYTYRQKPNKSILFPNAKLYLNIYNFGKRFYNESKIYNKISHLDEKYETKLNEAKKDSVKYEKLLTKKDKKELKLEKKLYEGNLLMRVGEPPSIYDYYYVEETVKQISLVAKQHGFHNTSIQTKIDSSKKKVKVTYVIKENKPLIYENIKFISKDTIARDLISRNKKKHYIKPNIIYNEKHISNERERAYTLLRDHGFHDFQRQYIYFEIDTGITKNRAYVNEYIQTPKNSTQHIQYKINQVVFKLDGDITTNDTTIFKNISYLNTSKKYSKKLLNSYIRIRPGDYYSLKKTEKTQQRLSEVDVFKYVNINFTKVDSNSLDVIIEAIPFEKYQLNIEGGVSVRVSQGNGLPGPFVNLNIKDRKIFRGFEILELGTRYAIQGQSSASDPGNILKSREFGINTSISLPKLLIPFRNSTSLLRDYSPKTRASLGFSDIARPEYRRQNFQFTYSYDWIKNRKKHFHLAPINASFINTTDKTESFSEYLDELKENGNNLFQSFQPSFVSSLLFSYTFNSRDLYGNSRPSNYLSFHLEPGGIMLSTYSSIFSNNKDSLFNVPYYQFGRVSVDYRHYKPINKNTTFAIRSELALAKPFGKSTILPYEKFFFSGGSNSNRAWFPRRLGPGSYSENADDDYRFEQPGEILVESNFEVRRKLIGFMYGAWFVDAGNIWTFEKDDSRPGSKFKPNNFFNEIAIGSGFGLRFDFSFIILRFDIGAKIRDPARPTGDRLVPWGSKNQLVFNLGIGNPF